MFREDHVRILHTHQIVNMIMKSCGCMKKNNNIELGIIREGFMTDSTYCAVQPNTDIA